jgi:S1-C subfamily serine protease
MNPRTGVFIDDVVPGGPGDIAGIEPNDIILSVNGKEVYHPGMLQLVIGNTAPGDTVQLAITRDGVTIILPTVIGLLKTAAVQEVEAMEATTLGMLVGERSSDSALTYGVAVEKVSEESVAALAGITEGDALLSINGENITGVEHYEQIVETLRAGTSVVAIVKSGDFVQFKTLVIPE